MTGGLPTPPEDDGCPHCSDGTLETWLDAGLKAVAGRRHPTLDHHTQCDTCGAERVTSVRLDDLKTIRGGWNNFPRQGSLEDHD